MNHFTASRTAGIPVEIPKDVAITTRVWGPTAWISRDIRVTGGGRLAGMILVGSPGAPGDPVRVVALRGAWCGRSECASPGSRFYFQDSWGTGQDDAGGTETIPQGEYMLFVVADGTRVDVRLRLRGLSGSRSAELTDPARGGIDVPSEGTGFGAPVAFSTYWSGRRVVLAGDEGFFLNLLRLKGDVWLRGRSGGCVYRGDPPPPPVAFAPRCPGGSDVGVEDGLVRTEFDSFQRHLAFVRPGGIWSFGHYYYAFANAREREELTFYLDIDHPGKQAGAT